MSENLFNEKSNLNESHRATLRVAPMPTGSGVDERGKKPAKPSLGTEIIRGGTSVMVLLTGCPSLKCCSHCEKRCHVRHIIIGPHKIDLKDPNVVRIIPKRSNLHQWWNIGPVRYFVETPSYDDPTGWYHIQHEISCPDPNCKGHDWQTVKERTGERKFGRARWAIIRIEAVVAPDTYKIIRTVRKD